MLWCLWFSPIPEEPRYESPTSREEEREDETGDHESCPPADEHEVQEVEAANLDEANDIVDRLESHVTSSNPDPEFAAQDAWPS